MERLDQWTPESPFLESATIDRRNTQRCRDGAHGRGDRTMGPVGRTLPARRSPGWRAGIRGGTRSWANCWQTSRTRASRSGCGLRNGCRSPGSRGPEGPGRRPRRLCLSGGCGIRGGASLRAAFRRARGRGRALHSAVAEGFSRYDLTYTSEAELESLVTQFVPALSMPLSRRRSNSSARSSGRSAAPSRASSISRAKACRPSARGSPPSAAP